MLNAQDILISENFDSYMAGDAVAEVAGAPWSTWSGTPGGVDDVMITSDQAYSGTNSMEFVGTAPAGGPGDLILQLGDRTTGVYSLSWWMYIPTGSGGYFNIQHTQTPGTQWGLDVMFLADGSIHTVADAMTDSSTTYAHDEWFQVNMFIDLNNSIGAFTVNQNMPITWQFDTQVGGEAGGLNQLGGINFFTYAGGTDLPHFYIDDVMFVDLSTVSVGENTMSQAVLYPNPVKDLLTIELPSNSGTTLVSIVDLTGRTVIEGASFKQQGNVARTQLDLAGMPQGLYMVRIQDGLDEVVYRVVKN
ncbi:MAG: T9SS type A sorting domain-containing protein [Bacteroidota bacterium]|nr:T9SS type A sorting domain-containing protein [Bacteroidota bacterium]